jgi:hypothetical protein
MMDFDFYTFARAHGHSLLFQVEAWPELIGKSNVQCIHFQIINGECWRADKNCCHAVF